MMRPLSDRALERLRQAAALPGFSGTRYTIQRELGSGGMGAVYLAEDTELERPVAVKVLHVEDGSPELADRILLEARAMAQLEHPNILPVYDVGRLPEGRLFFVMRYVEGQRLDAYGDAGHTLPERLRLFGKICDAVAFAHSRGVLHRDLKPENIMVGRFNEVLIMDWGLARWLREQEPGGRVMGTPDYMAPEQQRGDPTVDERADVYALGRILQELAGPQAPKPLRAIAAKAQAAEREQRYSSVAELADDVWRYLDGLAVTAHPETIVERCMRFWRNNRTLLLLVLTYFVARALIFFLTRF